MVTERDVDLALCQLAEDVEAGLKYLEGVKTEERLGLFCARSSLMHALSVLGDLAEKAALNQHEGEAA